MPMQPSTFNPPVIYPSPIYYPYGIYYIPNFTPALDASQEESTSSHAAFPQAEEVISSHTAFPQVEEVTSSVLDLSQKAHGWLNREKLERALTYYCDDSLKNTKTALILDGQRYTHDLTSPLLQFLRTQGNLSNLSISCCGLEPLDITNIIETVATYNPQLTSIHLPRECMTPPMVKKIFKDTNIDYFTVNLRHDQTICVARSRSVITPDHSWQVVTPEAFQTMLSPKLSLKKPRKASSMETSDPTSAPSSSLDNPAVNNPRKRCRQK